jgi:hypothetical protein
LRSGVADGNVDGLREKRRINIRSAPAPKHQSVTKTDPGGVARHPDDVELDRKVGSESVNGRFLTRNRQSEAVPVRRSRALVATITRLNMASLP